MTDYSSEGEVVGTVTMRPKTKFTVSADGSKGTTSAEKPLFEQWLCDEAIAAGHTTVDKESLKDTYTRVRNRAKRMFGADAVQASTDRVVKQVLKWREENEYDPKAERAVAVSDRGDWPGKRPSLPPKGMSLGSAVPSEFKRGGAKRKDPTPVEVDEDLPPIVEEEDKTPPEGEADVDALIQRAAQKMLKQEPLAKQLPEVTLEDWPTRNWYLDSKPESVSHTVTGAKLENCKILDCPKLAMRPIQVGKKGQLSLNGFMHSVCLVPEMEMPAQCPQEQVMAPPEKEVYDSIVGSVGEDAARKAVFKIRAMVKKKQAK